MNREIKFRGRRIDNGEWVYGNYVFNDQFKEHQIVSFYKGIRQPKKVDPETVGQYTGLKDKNDKEIYEGDIVQTDDPYTRMGSDSDQLLRVITLNESRFDLFYVGGKRQVGGWVLNEEVGSNHMEIIGNIYQDKHLIE